MPLLTAVVYLRRWCLYFGFRDIYDDSFSIDAVDRYHFYYWKFPSSKSYQLVVWCLIFGYLWLDSRRKCMFLCCNPLHHSKYASNCWTPQRYLHIAYAAYHLKYPYQSTTNYSSRQLPVFYPFFFLIDLSIDPCVEFTTLID